MPYELASHRGELRDKAGALLATCTVKVEREGPIKASFVCNVTPPLPDGRYELSVNGVAMDIECKNGVWHE